MDDIVWRIGWIEFGECAAHVAGDAGRGEAWHDAVGHHECALESHDLGKGSGDWKIPNQRLQLQCVHAEGA